MADTKKRKSLGDLLLEEGLVTEEQLKAAQETVRQKGGFLGEALVEMGLVSQDDVLLLLGRQAGMDVVDLEKMEIPEEVIRRISPDVARLYQIFPIKFEGDTLTVAMANPLNMNTLDDLRFMLDCKVVGAVSRKSAVLDAIERRYGPKAES